MDGIIKAIIIIEVLLILCLVGVLCEDHYVTQIKCVYTYVPNISEVVGSYKKYDLSGSWTSDEEAGTGNTLTITNIDRHNSKVTIIVNRTGDPTSIANLTGILDHYNGILYYGENDTALKQLILDPVTKNRLVDPRTAEVYNRSVKSSVSVDPSAILSGKYKDIHRADIIDTIDITVDNYFIRGSLETNDIVGFINPKNNDVVIFMRGLVIPGVYDSNVFYLQFGNNVYQYEKV